MLTVFIISLREFLEAFLITGVFLTISRKLNLKKEKEIILALLSAVFLTIILAFLVYFSSDKARLILTEKNVKLLEGYLMIFAGLFLAYVVFSLHRVFVYERSKKILEAHQKLNKRVFDLSIFATIFFIVFREGFEIALFTSTTALFFKFLENIAGFFAGLLTASVFTGLTFLGSLKFSINKIYKATEYLIIFLGASMVKNGVKELIETYFNLHLKTLLPVTLGFIPAKNNFFTHFLNSFFGLERNFSLVYLFIIIGYLFLVKKFLVIKR